MSDGSALSVEVGKRLGRFQLQARFQAAPAGVTALFGTSGAGKSALLSMIAGTLRPDAGRIALGSDVLFDSAAGLDLRPELRSLGWMTQEPRLFPHLSVRENLRYGLKRAGARPRRVEFDEAVEVLGIEPLLQRRPRDLSGGERQRVALGRALLSQPRLLMLDEPLSALDQARKAEILPLLERLPSFGLPILYVTHSMTEVLRLADRLVVMSQGRVAAEGPLAAVLAGGDIPLLTERADVGVAIEATLAEHHTRQGLSRLSGDGFELLISQLTRPPGSRVRAIVLARDVMLAISRPQGVSARNLLPGTLESLSLRADSSVLARVRIGPAQTLLSTITPDAVQALGLRPGLEVWAVVKSVAVEGGNGRGLLALLDE